MNPDSEMLLWCEMCGEGTIPGLCRAKEGKCANGSEKLRAAHPSAAPQGAQPAADAAPVPQEVERDAKRYRFLRDAVHPETNGGLRCVGNCADGGKPLHIDGRDLDRAIDAAMNAGLTIPAKEQ